MSKKINFGTQEEFINKYEELGSAQKVGEFYGCSKTPVLRYAKEIGYVYKQDKLSAQDKEQIIQSYYTSTSAELAEQYNVSRGMITKVWFDAGLKGKAHKGSRTIDLIGQTFGYLTVLSRSDKVTASGEAYWNCQCSKCGTIRPIASSSLRKGSAISCGCVGRSNLELGRGHNFIDRTGQKYGKLTVLSRNLERMDAVYWNCICDCGRTSVVLSSNLHNGNTQSCGKCGENSHGNIKIEKLLLENNIPFIREKRFDSCKDKTYLPFDFFVANSYLIEFDGKQHYQDSAWEPLEDIQRRDRLKNIWCKNNNIPLIRIPYNKLNSLTIEDLLLETSDYII